MDLVGLQIFKTVAELGGITKAAAALHRVQSNVTTRVKQLEDRVGAKLFHRQGRRLVLSSEGKVLLAYADRMLLPPTARVVAGPLERRGGTRHGIRLLSRDHGLRRGGRRYRGGAEVRAARDRHRSSGRGASAALERRQREDHARMACGPSV